MKQAIDLALANVVDGIGGPFGAVVVRAGEVVGTGTNRVTRSNDPTAHAEMAAIRAACEKLNTFRLDDCELYTSCEPCPMCLGAIYWARLQRFYYACNRLNAARAGFDDAFIYDQVAIEPMIRSIPGIELCPDLSNLPFDAWRRSTTKRLY